MISLTLLLLGGLAAAMGGVVLLRSGQLAGLARGGRLLRVMLPAEFSDGAVEQLLLALHGALRRPLARLIYGQPWFAIEFASTPAGPELRLWAPEAVPAEFVGRHLDAAFPGARLEPLTEAPGLQGEVALAALTTQGSGMLRLRTPGPGLSALLAGMRGLAADEAVELQLLVQPLSPGRQARLLAEANRLLRGRRERGQLVRPTLAARATAQRLQAKAAAPLFAVEMRILARAATAERAKLRVRAVVSGLHQFGTAELHFRRRPILFGRRFQDAMRDRRLPMLPVPTALNSLELAAVLAVTPELAQEAGLPIARGRQLSPPPGVAGHGRVFAQSIGAGGARLVALPIEEARRHLHVIGPTGTGKSTLLQTLALSDLRAGRGVVVLDPKGDLVEALLERLPEERRVDLVLLDPADLEWPVGLNMLDLQPGDEPDLVCDHLVAIFRGIYSQFWGPRTDDILKAACLTLLHEPGATLAEVPLLLTDDAFRARYIAKLDDPVALEPFWAWYESLREAQRADAIGPVQNKLRDFLLRRRLRNIVGQPTSTIDFRQILAERKVLLVSLAKGLIGEEASALLGSFVIAKLWQATLARAAVPQGERPDVVCYVDEFQSYIRLPESFEEILAQARSFRLALNLAHQHLSQLPAGLRAAVLANARSRVVFQCGAADARLLAHEFEPYLGERDLRALGPYETAVALSVAGNVTRPFTATTLPPSKPLRQDPAPLREQSRGRYGRPRAEVEDAIRSRLTLGRDASSGSFGRRSVGTDT